MIVNLDCFIAFVQTEGHSKVYGVADTFDAVIMEEVVLLLALLDLHLELSVLLLLLDADKFAQDISEEGWVVDGVTASFQ